MPRRKQYPRPVVAPQPDLNFTFERRIRYLVRSLQQRFPTLSREAAMDRARRVPPTRIVEAIRKVNARYVRQAIPPVSSVRESE